MIHTQRLTRIHLLGAVAFIALASAASAQIGFVTSITPYTVPVTDDYTIIPLLSSGDTVPRTSNPAQQYKMVGIPDGLGAYGNTDGTLTLFMNHELRNNNNSLVEFQ